MPLFGSLQADVVGGKGDCPENKQKKAITPRTLLYDRYEVGLCVEECRVGLCKKTNLLLGHPKSSISAIASRTYPTRKVADIHTDRSVYLAVERVDA